jgi:hypothetical protein
MLSEAQELLDTVNALRHKCAVALRVAMQGVRCECVAAVDAGGAALTPTSSRHSSPSTRKLVPIQRVEAEVPEPEAEAAHGNTVGIDLEALRAAVNAAQAAGIDTKLFAAGAALLVSKEARQAQKAAEMRERLEEVARAAATIQSPVRGRAARQRCGEMRTAAARQLAAVARIQAAARGVARRRPYSAMRAASLLLQAAARRHAVRMLANELLLGLRLLRNGHVFIKFSQDNSQPHDRLVQLQAKL